MFNGVCFDVFLHGVFGQCAGKHIHPQDRVKLCMGLEFLPACLVIYLEVGPCVKFKLVQDFEDFV